MLFTLLMVLYVVLAVFMIGFILIQRGAGAAAGSGFGGGASATVFGARGASSFLTKATKWLAIAFFALTLGMAMYVQRTGLAGRAASDDLGIMSGVAAPVSDVPSASTQSAAPAASDVPAAAPAGDAPSEGEGEVPAASAAPASDTDSAPEAAQGDEAAATDEGQGG